jgi:uncharacterized protein (TIGR02147 family)
MKHGKHVSVYDYLDYRKFLGDWYAARKDADHRFSHRLFARKAGVRSPSLFNEVVGGRRNLTQRTMEGFGEGLSLNKEESAFFYNLVQLDQAKTDDEKNEAYERVAASRRFRSARSIEGATFRYLSHWYYPAVRELALRDDFVADPAWVAERLLPEISITQAREALDTLFELGMLVEEEGDVHPAEVSVATAHEVSGLAVANYHRQMLDRVAEAITVVPPAERHLLGVTVGIPEELIPVLKGELDAFQERVLHMCDEHAASAARVYQLQLGLVPLSIGKAKPKKKGENS